MASPSVDRRRPLFHPPPPSPPPLLTCLSAIAVPCAACASHPKSPRYRRVRRSKCAACAGFDTVRRRLFPMSSTSAPRTSTTWTCFKKQISSSKSSTTPSCTRIPPLKAHALDTGWQCKHIHGFWASACGLRASSTCRASTVYLQQRRVTKQADAGGK